MTEKKLEILLEELEKDPKNLDLINLLALFYFENNDKKTDKEDYDNFEKAYNLEKTVKSTHNFAWFLYFEWSEIEWRWKQKNAIERAILIQKECMQLNPKSYYPYYQYGYMLLDQKRFEEAIVFLESAYKIEKHWDILHNIGYCHFQLEKFEKAKECFSKSVTEFDIENKSLYNLALTEWKLNNTEDVKLIAEKLSKNIKTNAHSSVSRHEIGLLYFILEDFHHASECLIQEGIKGIDLLEWNELSYSLYIINNKLWRETITDSIYELKKWRSEIVSNHGDWSGYNEDEKKGRLTEFEIEIELRERFLNRGLTKPIPELNKSLISEYCGCLLFDCNKHGNKKNDI